MISLNDKKDCMGCYACSNICPINSISMISDMEGFWYPQVDYDKCTKCGQCRKVCPILNKPSPSNVPSTYACINKEEAVRLESSSGGIFTLIAEQVIENGGVVFGAGFNDDFTLKHSFIEKKEELFKFRGSKYVQSRIGNTYSQVKNFLKLGRSVLFTGTPCQIGALKSYLGQSYDNLICVDIICHGVPSPKVWKKYILYREEVAGSSVQSISFRQKNEGWKRYSMSFLFKDNTEYSKTLDKDMYMKVFLKDTCLRPSCYACNFKSIHRHSDITLADFWGIQSILPDMDDDKGTSLIFVNTSKGREVFGQIENKMRYKKVDIDQAIEFNSAAIRSAESNQNRSRFFDELDETPFDELANKYCTDKYSVRVKRKVKIIICKILEKIGLLRIVKQVL